MSRVPEIVTERLVLRGFCLSDAADVFAYARNPNVLRHTTGRTPTTVADSERFLESLLEAPEGEFAWAIRLRDEPTVIGAIEFGLGDGVMGAIHYALGEAFWSQGLMTEACRAVLAWAFETYPALERVTTSAVVENRGSTRVMEKSGMEFQGFRDEKWDKFDEPVKLAIYSITRDRWERGR